MREYKFQLEFKFSINPKDWGPIPAREKELPNDESHFVISVTGSQHGGHGRLRQQKLCSPTNDPIDQQDQ
jgi:hypothetical protein